MIDKTALTQVINETLAETDMFLVRLTVSRDKLEPTEAPAATEKNASVNFIGKSTRDSMHETRLNFKSDIDVRGMSGQEALEAVTYFIEDAIQCASAFSMAPARAICAR